MPPDISGTKCTKKLLKNKKGCQLYCGEFGVIDSAPASEAVKWMKDLISILDSFNIGHALWNYKYLDFGLLPLNGEIVSQALLDYVINS